MFLKELHYVITIAQEGSVTRAAQKLYISQSALSQFLAEYERQLGFSIFYRNPHGVIPTVEGELFIKMSEKLIRQFYQVVQSVTTKDPNTRKSIRFGISEQRAVILTPRLISLFSQQVPEISLDVIDGDARELRKMVRVGQLDLALSASLQAGSSVVDGVSCRPFQLEEFMVAIPKNHPLAKKLCTDKPSGQSWVSIRDLKNETFVLINKKRPMRVFIDAFLQKDGIRPQILQTSTNMSTILRICRNQNALTFIPQGMIVDGCDMRYASIGKRGKFWNLNIVTALNHKLTQLEIDFIEILRECLSRIASDPQEP